ncbi:MAG: hypothetical protein ACI8P3_003091 [Saprospiraceae bacterium]|jgi:hypothetical protein
MQSKGSVKLTLSLDFYFILFKKAWIIFVAIFQNGQLSGKVLKSDKFFDSQIIRNQLII